MVDAVRLEDCYGGGVAEAEAPPSLWGSMVAVAAASVAGGEASGIARSKCVDELVAVLRRLGARIEAVASGVLAAEPGIGDGGSLRLSCPFVAYLAAPIAAVAMRPGSRLVLRFDPLRAPMVKDAAVAATLLGGRAWPGETPGVLVVEAGPPRRSLYGRLGSSLAHVAVGVAVAAAAAGARGALILPESVVASTWLHSSVELLPWARLEGRRLVLEPPTTRVHANPWPSLGGLLAGLLPMLYGLGAEEALVPRLRGLEEAAAALGFKVFNENGEMLRLHAASPRLDSLRARDDPDLIYVAAAQASALGVGLETDQRLLEVEGELGGGEGCSSWLGCARGYGALLSGKVTRLRGFEALLDRLPGIGEVVSRVSQCVLIA